MSHPLPPHAHNTHCATLFEYAEDAELYFTSDTTLVFLLGDQVFYMNICICGVIFAGYDMSMRFTGSSSFSSKSAVQGDLGISKYTDIQWKYQLY